MHSARIHERFLRYIWNNQYLRTAALRTVDGRAVVVEYTGRLNFNAGPDVRAACVRIGETRFVGDVEIHRTMAEWYLHSHNDDPEYNSVILHVVLDRPTSQERTVVRSGRDIPVLVLGDFLADTLRIVWQEAILDERAHRTATIPCFQENDTVPRDVIEPWLDRLEVERLEIKLRRFEERLRDLAYQHLLSVHEVPRTWGDPPDEDHPDNIPSPFPNLTRSDLARRELWEQILYEGILEGLGYSKNRKPFIRLSQMLTLAVFRRLGADVLQSEALLFGVSGLLPESDDELDDEAQSYISLLKKEWKSLKWKYAGDLLTPTDWTLSPTRPTNAPSLRLVAAREIVRKIFQEDLFRSMVQCLKDRSEPKKSRVVLHALLETAPGPFWERHLSFSRKTSKPVTPLGDSRKDDIIVNTILPIGLLYARVFHDNSVREGTLRLLRSFPPNQPNALTIRMEKQLTKGRVALDSAARQQAVIQLFKYYCEEERCGECAIGKFLWGRRRVIDE